MNAYPYNSFVKLFNSKPLQLVMIISFAFCFNVGEPFAHQVDAKKLERELTSISRQLRDLRNQLSQVNSSGGGSSLDGNSRALLADMEIRLGSLDRGVRNLTGQVEEMSHRQMNLEREFEKFKADMELRFQDMSQPQASLDVEPAPTSEELAEQIDEATEMVEQPQQIEPQVKSAQLTMDNPEENYEAAFGYLRRGDFQAAESGFKAFIEQFQDHELAGNAQYWLAETYYARRDYPNAASAFLEGIQKYAQSNKAADSLLKLGMSLSAMGQEEEACIVFEDLLIRHEQAPENIKNSATREIERNSCR